LEIGSDLGYTVFSIQDSFSYLVGIDINRSSVESSNKHPLKTEKIDFIEGTINTIPYWDYDVIFIDANHEYDYVRKDALLSIKNNKKEDYSLFFHDYGLKGLGVKKFIHHYFYDNEIIFCGQQKDWNPLGLSTSDWEAVCIRINPKITERINKGIKIK